MEFHIGQVLNDHLPNLPEDVWLASANPTLRALRRPGYVSHADIARPLAEWLGLDSPLRQRMEAWLLLLQIVIDLTDNIADWNLDRAGPLEPHRAYEGIAFATLSTLPTLYLAAFERDVFLHCPKQAPSITRRVLDILTKMALGQTQTHGSDASIEAISAQQGLLLCLPAWMLDQDEDPSRLVVLERWALAFGRTWELREQAHDHPNESSQVRLSEGCRQAITVWPFYPPFRGNGPLAMNRLLPRGMS